MNLKISKGLDNHIAVAGVSTKKTKFGSFAYRTLKKNGYNVYPIHPSMDTFDGDRCYQSLTDLPELPDWLFVCVSPNKAGSLVDDAIHSGVKRIWFQRGADFSEYATKARENGLEVITGKCILMYAEPVKGIHALHRFFCRLFGKY